MILRRAGLLVFASLALTFGPAGPATADRDPAPPSAEELDDQLTTGLDPVARLWAWTHPVRNAHKLAFVQGAQADPELPYRLAQTVHETGAKLRIIGVNPKPLGEAFYANANITLNGQTTPAEIPFVDEDGTWKVELIWACTMLSMFGEQSPACD
ncbi:hypothetical protein FEK35_03430 [Nocardia cyriacigeorgica]|uniref:Low molecular weight antigen MTB12-like C-terminal domain-containing protein n=1 Tax=Nocardia cyriacigeorgica TaxID=135487 RepID=A0A5R8PJ66_9NOCA|nr:hypothetical protein [Nocardia cyriacigeorgica]TLG16342.1 hypothetical protein FEK35_03430 [Nocardia cyriacigeorgica]